MVVNLYTKGFWDLQAYFPQIILHLFFKPSVQYVYFWSHAIKWNNFFAPGTSFSGSPQIRAQ